MSTVKPDGNTPPTWQRLGPALSRRLRLAWMRLRFPRARFGAGCDIRRGFHLVLGPGASSPSAPSASWTGT